MLNWTTITLELRQRQCAVFQYLFANCLALAFEPSSSVRVLATIAHLIYLAMLYQRIKLID